MGSDARTSELARAAAGCSGHCFASSLSRAFAPPRSPPAARENASSYALHAGSPGAAAAAPGELGASQLDPGAPDPDAAPGDPGDAAPGVAGPEDPGAGVAGPEDPGAGVVGPGALAGDPGAGDPGAGDAGPDGAGCPQLVPITAQTPMAPIRMARTIRRYHAHRAGSCDAVTTGAGFLPLSIVSADHAGQHVRPYARLAMCACTERHGTRDRAPRLDDAEQGLLDQFAAVE
ncbi:MAG: hypothetical protein E6J90_01210 [Deltaproteobacteria bacterium]|nr:MAG: hypothetical protein E6J90_01210 [Deltaproteobacteria bacterium]